MKSNLILRTVTGICFICVVVGCIMWHPMAFGILFALVSACSTYEFAQIINRSGKASLSAFNLACCSFVLFGAVIVYRLVGSPQLFCVYGLLLLFLMIEQLYLKKSDPLANWAFNLMSQLYIALPFALLNMLAFATGTDGKPTYEWHIPLFIFVFIWLNDTMAYCFGSLLGRHKLFERISPKKSWEGSIGGGLMTLVGGWVVSLFYGQPLMWIGLALVVVVFGTWGDLCESLLKRQVNIKDSGHILPGHGGWLDRFDSSLFAIPAAVIYLCLWSAFQ